MTIDFVDHKNGTSTSIPLVLSPLTTPVAEAVVAEEAADEVAEEDVVAVAVGEVVGEVDRVAVKEVGTTMATTATMALSQRRLNRSLHLL